MYDTIAKHKISPPDVRSWDEERLACALHRRRRAAFLRNWSYVHPIAEDPKSSSIAGKVGVAPLPHFAKGKSAACLGGYQYGVNAATKNRDAAIEFLKWLSSPETQLRFAVELRTRAEPAGRVRFRRARQGPAVPADAEAGLRRRDGAAGHPEIRLGDAGAAIGGVQGRDPRQRRRGARRGQAQARADRRLMAQSVPVPERALRKRSAQEVRGAGASSTPLLFLVPAAARLASVSVYLILDGVRLSLRDTLLSTQDDNFVGLANYAALAEDDQFWSAWQHTFAFTAASTHSWRRCWASAWRWCSRAVPRPRRRAPPC